jgi:hypothetical protein
MLLKFESDSSVRHRKNPCRLKKLLLTTFSARERERERECMESKKGKKKEKNGYKDEIKVEGREKRRERWKEQDGRDAKVKNCLRERRIKIE